MDAVILAAGRGQRMVGLAKPFYKPLLEINGLPLIAYAVEYASAAGAAHVTVVASYENFGDIRDALHRYSGWVTIDVQETPSGPGHATLVGMGRSRGGATMLLMSDNIMDQDAVVAMATNCRIHSMDAIGVRSVTREQASRFTRLRFNYGKPFTFVEGIEVTDRDLWIDDTVKVWCGPVIFDTEIAYDILSTAWNTHDKETEMKIGTHLNSILRSPFSICDVKAFDVGVPAVYMAHTNTGSL